MTDADGQIGICMGEQNGEFLMKPQKRDKVWNVKYIPGDVKRDGEVETLKNGLGVSSNLARLLHNRGYSTPDAADRFLRNEDSILHSPFLMKDIELAVERIETAVKNHEKVVIYGDYDVDGVTAVSLLWLYLRARGVNVDYYIPSRSGEGYGLSENAIDRLKKSGTDLIITVDTGITANAEAEYARSIGVDMVITDHHECRADLPNACAVVNPHRPDCEYPFKELAGVGVVFKVICACEITCARERGEADIDAVRRISYEYADLVAIGTVADVMPITDENRLIVAMGLRLISNEPRLGLSALITASANIGSNAPAAGNSRQYVKKPKITSNYIGYGIAPRINAAGRISNASTAVKLLLAENKAQADDLAAELCDINRRRQIEENRIAEQAYKKIEQEFDFEKDRVIVLEDDNWQQGIIGIVSSRITEKYGLPSVLISFDGSTRGYASFDDTGKGSGRSVKGMNLVEALNYCEDILVKYGGHELAAGLTIERKNISEFKNRINEYARINLSEEDLTVNLEADCALKMNDITIGLANELYNLEPFGVSNPVPTFVMYDAQAIRIMPISGGKHTKLILAQGDNTICAMCFNMPASRFPIHEGESADILFTVDVNEFQNVKSVQMIVRDIRRSRKSCEDDMNMRRRYEEVIDGGAFYAEEDFIPDRDDCAAVYTLLRREFRMGHDALSDRAILSLLKSNNDGCNINYVKLMYIFKIFRELKICTVESIGDGLFCFDVSFNSTKTSIDKSSILKKLKGQCKNRA